MKAALLTAGALVIAASLMHSAAADFLPDQNPFVLTHSLSSATHTVTR